MTEKFLVRGSLFLVNQARRTKHQELCLNLRFSHFNQAPIDVTAGLILQEGTAGTESLARSAFPLRPPVKYFCRWEKRGQNFV